ncbi:MAG: hypothetical protein CVT73_03935 [Alphaproteobacteria bacterium HGW-Alphaproteobacteria-12]|nr:MAG: hypothetical protein CVT73_03935 [Alphaproteobacteria bacterium HGW-Alphaproteobacteria-12]
MTPTSRFETTFVSLNLFRLLRLSGSILSISQETNHYQREASKVPEDSLFNLSGMFSRGIWTFFRGKSFSMPDALDQEI